MNADEAAKTITIPAEYNPLQFADMSSYFQPRVNGYINRYDFYVPADPTLTA